MTFHFVPLVANDDKHCKWQLTMSTMTNNVYDDKRHTDFNNIAP